MHQGIGQNNKDELCHLNNLWNNLKAVRRIYIVQNIQIIIKMKIIVRMNQEIAMIVHLKTLDNSERK